MKLKVQNVRKVRFGLRIKFSIIIIISVTFVTSLIGFLVFNQHEYKIQQEIHRLGEIILKGAAEDVGNYLYSDQILQNYRKYNLSNNQIIYQQKRKNESLQTAADYFSNIIGKERFLDIAYLIKVNWTDIDVKWDRSDQARYLYFSRGKGKISINIKNDRQLKPSIYNHYMHDIDINTYLTFFKGRTEDEEDFVILGKPLFKKNSDLKIYSNYLKLKDKKFANIKEINEYNKQLKNFEKIFVKRLVEHNTKINYIVTLDNDKKFNLLYYFFPRHFQIYKLNRQKRNELKNFFITVLKNNTKENEINLENLKKIIRSTISKYKLTIKPGIFQKIKQRGDLSYIWKRFYYFLNYNKIEMKSPHSLEKLALYSYRKDLAGILGLYFLRTKFFEDINKSRNDIINLAISILIRCIIIALFFPTFIIRSVTNLAEGAMEIGRGHLDKRIEISGSDELGRLADIFNVMTGNLKKAQDTMLEKQRMHEELKTAQFIQQTLLPAEYPVIKNIEFGAYYSAQTESGGDYFDFIDLGNNLLGITIADVSGHGVGSGLVMAMTRTLLHIHCKNLNNPKKILSEINQYLYENTASNYFVSMFYGILDINHLKINYSSAGHDPGLILRNKKIQELPAGGIALGAAGNTTFSNVAETKSAMLKKGDCFIQYTDGVVEAMDKDNNEFGEERFYKALETNHDKPPKKIIAAVIAEVSKFTGNIEQHDDITMIIIKIV